MQRGRGPGRWVGWSNAFATLGLLVCGCDRLDPNPPSVVLVTLDTVRADHLGCYGHTRATTPFLDRLASGGVRFTHAFTPSPHTAPSHASILTSLYPEQHRVLRNGESLDAAIPTLASVLGAAGFETAAFVSVAFLRKLTPGFDVVDYVAATARPYRRADETVGAAVAWLEARDSEDPFLLWLHLYDAHEHARADHAPEAWLARVRALPDPGLEARVARLAASEGTDPDLTRRHLETYDAQILFQDDQLRALFAAVERSVGRSLWVVTADHGEGMGDHGHWGHGMLVYDEQIRVPLIVADTADRRGRVVDRLVRHVDLLPTIAELAGVSSEANSERIEGRSLAALLDDPGATWPIERTYAQTPIGSPFLQRQGWKPGIGLAVQEAGSKYIFNTTRRNEFYDLAKDPGELRNRVHSGTRREKRLAMWVLSEYDRHRRDRRSFAAPIVPTREERKLLERLGYQ